jgi:hypothetical protein
MSMIDVAHEHAVSVAISLSRCKKPNHRRNVYMIRSIFFVFTFLFLVPRVHGARREIDQRI